MDLKKLKDLSDIVGKQRLVLDLSCRKKVWLFYLGTIDFVFKNLAIDKHIPKSA